MPKCRGFNEHGRKKGQPCGNWPLVGEEYCHKHIKKPPILDADKQAALLFIELFEREFLHRVPDWKVARLVADMRGRIDHDQAMVNNFAIAVSQSVEQGRSTAAALAQLLADEWKILSKQIIGPSESVDPVRTGTRLQVKTAESFRAPTAMPAKDLMAIFLQARPWKNEQIAISAEHGETQMRIDCDASLGFGPERAIQQIAQYGPAVAQTFLALAGLWVERNAGRPRDFYLEAYASDLLRFMGRKQVPEGGYHSEDILALGKHVFILKRVTVPKARQEVYRRNKRIVQRLSLGNLFVVDDLEVQRALDLEGNELQSVVRFRYHMGSEMYGWLCGDHPQYALASGKLLHYHPNRDKYHILLGFCLTYHDRVNRKNADTRKISLPALLQLAGLDVPKVNLPNFWKAVQRALTDLSTDRVIPGLSFNVPGDGGNMSMRQMIDATMVCYPSIELPEEAPQKALSFA